MSKLDFNIDTGLEQNATPARAPRWRNIVRCVGQVRDGPAKVVGVILHPSKEAAEKWFADWMAELKATGRSFVKWTPDCFPHLCCVWEISGIRCQQEPVFDE